MVTRQGKDLLKNTIQSVGFHNKVLEEQEMWKQWELERGLTMMVSDDHIRERIAARAAEKERAQSNRSLPKESKSSREKRGSQKRQKSPRNSVICNGRTVGKTTVAPEDRWDHSGFFELEYGSAIYEQGKSDKQRDRSTSSDSSREDSPRTQYGPRPPPSLQTSQHRERKRRHERKPLSLNSPSSSSSYESDETQKKNSEDSDDSSEDSSSGRSPKRRRYGKSRGERRGRSPTRRRVDYQGQTYGQCLKIRQAHNQRAEKRAHKGRAAYLSSSDSESSNQSESDDDSSDELSDSDNESLSSSSVESDEKLSSRRANSHHLNRKRDRHHSPKKTRHRSYRSHHKESSRRR